MPDFMIRDSKLCEKTFIANYPTAGVLSYDGRQEELQKLKTIAEAAKATVKSWTSGDPNTFVRAMRNLERLLELQDDR